VALDPAVSALLDPIRLKVAGVLVDSDLSTEQIVELTELDRRTVLEAVAALRQATLVDSVDGTYRLPAERLLQIAADQADSDLPMDPSIGFGMTDDERVVLSRYFEARTLIELPSSRAKRLIVLERLALEFDPGRRYPEHEVNKILHEFNTDWSTLRRNLVDEGFLDRNHNVYWRSGGRT
jgi:hypothetical protein